MKKRPGRKSKKNFQSKNVILVILLACVTIFTILIIGNRSIFTPHAETITGTQYYVDSVGGSDTNTGTSESAAWKSLDKVTSSSFAAGDVVNFKRGSTWNTTLTIASNGSNGSPVTYQAYGTGTAPTIDTSANDGIDISGNYNVVKDFLIKNVSHYGVNITGAHNTVSDNEFANVGSGIWIAGGNNLITRNNAHNLKMINNTPGGDDDYGATGYIINSANNEISYNTCTDCTAPSYDYGSDGGFVEVWQVGDNSYIHNNHAVNTNGFFELGGDNSGTANGIKIQYNIIDSTGSLLCAHTSGGFAIPTSNVTIDNNTVINSAGIVCDMPSGLSLRNNIFYGDSPSGSGFTHTNNLYSSQPGYSLGSGEKVGNPLFVNASGGDYHLQAGSPAIDAGANLGFTRDFENGTVPVGSAPDIGAYEYGSTPQSSPAPNPSTAPSVAVTTIIPSYDCVGGVNCGPSSNPTNASPSNSPSTVVSQVPLTQAPPTSPGRGGNSFIGFILLLFQLILQFLRALIGR